MANLWDCHRSTVSFPARVLTLTSTSHLIQTWSRSSIINWHRVQRSQAVSFYKHASRTDSRRFRVQMLQHQSSPWCSESEMKERAEGAWKGKQRLKRQILYYSTITALVLFMQALIFVKSSDFTFWFHPFSRLIGSFYLTEMSTLLLSSDYLTF